MRAANLEGYTLINGVWERTFPDDAYNDAGALKSQAEIDLEKKRAEYKRAKEPPPVAPAPAPSRPPKAAPPTPKSAEQLATMTDDQVLQYVKATPQGELLRQMKALGDGNEQGKRLAAAWRKAVDDSPATMGVVWTIVENAFEQFIKEVHNPLVERMNKMNELNGMRNDRIKALEAAQSKTLADAYKGTWQPNNAYARGSLITWSGSLWLALADTSDKPGNGDTWKMIVKAGKDAR